MKALNLLNFNRLIQLDVEKPANYSFNLYRQNGYKHPRIVKYCTSCEKKAISTSSSHATYRLTNMSHGAHSVDFFQSSLDPIDTSGWHVEPVMFIFESPSIDYEIYRKGIKCGKVSKNPPNEWFWVHADRERGLIGLQKGDKKSARAKYWKEYLKLKVFRMGFTQATCTRYIEAWESAISLYPLPFVNEMASRLFGERVGPKTPFGRYTPWIAQVASKADKKDLDDASKVAPLVQTILLGFKPARRGRVARDFMLAAYDSIMQNLYRYASKDDKDVPISGLGAKDIFLDELVPLVLLGLGCAKGFKETVEVALSKLPEGYEPFEEFAPRETTTEPAYVVREKGGHWGVYHKMNHVSPLFKGTKEECEAHAAALDNKPQPNAVNKAAQKHDSAAAG